MIISGTGHRPDRLNFRGLGGYTDVARQALETFAENTLIELQPTLVISGMAQGWDMALAEAAVRLKIPFNAAVPFGGQESMWPESTQKRYRELLKKAHTVRVISSGDYSAWKMQVRNEYMVRSCDLLVALWNGESGGTANCVRYATSVGREMEPVSVALVTAAGLKGAMCNAWEAWRRVAAPG